MVRVPLKAKKPEHRLSLRLNPAICRVTQTSRV